MTPREPTESDWKKFRSIVPALRERYLSARNVELIAILQREAVTETENFWAASKRVEEVRRILTACLDDPRRSTMMHAMRLMYHHRMITDEDLTGFSEAVRERIAL